MSSVQEPAAVNVSGDRSGLTAVHVLCPEPREGIQKEAVGIYTMGLEDENIWITYLYSRNSNFPGSF